MAMTAFEVFGLLKLDVSEFNKGLDKAKSSAQSGFGGVASALGKGASVLGGGLVTAAKAGAAAIGAATTGAVAFGKSAVSAASEYESAFTGVRKTVDATEDEFNELSSWIMDASTRMASSQEEIAGTMEIAGQLGVSGVEGLKKFTETMIMLGDTTNLNAEEAASALAKFGNIAGLQPEEMDKIGSVIVDLGNHFATTEADIVEMSSRLASAGTIAGFSATDVLALSTAMSSVGINAEAGGTAMSTIMTKIGRAVDEGVDPSNEKLALFAQTAGMSAEQFAAAWKASPTTALQGFVKGLDGMIDSGGNVTAVLDDLGIKGIREANTIRSLALASDVLTGAVDMANTAFEENVALQNEANLRYGTTESQAVQMANSFKNLRIAIGEELKPMYGELMSFSTGAIQAMQQGFEEGGLEGLMASLGTAISDGLAMLNEKLPDFVNAGMSLLGALGQGIMDNLDVIINAGIEILKTLGSAFVTGLPTIIEAGLQILDALLSAFSENIDVIIEAVGGMITEIGNAIDAHSDSIGESGMKILETLFNALMDNLPQLVEFVLKMLSNFVTWVSENIDKIIEVAVTIINVLATGLANALPDLIPAVVDIVLAIVEALIDNIDLLIDAAIALIIGLAEGLINALPRLIEKAPVIIEKLVQALIRNTPKIIQAAIELIFMLIKGLMDSLPKIVKAGWDILTSLIRGINDYMRMLPEEGEKIINSIWDGIKSLDPVQWGKDMIQSFIYGIMSMIGSVGDAVGSVANTIKDFLGFSEPDKGPLSKFHTFAPDMMSLFSEGIKENTDLVTDQIAKSFDFSDVIVDQNVKVDKTTDAVSAGATSIVMNVYGAPGQDINELAEIISRKIDNATGRRMMAMGAV